MDRFVSNKAHWALPLLFIVALAASIVFSSFYPIPTAHSEIGVSANILRIGDRADYINDSEPFSSEKRNPEFNVYPLYPLILKGVSYVSIEVFNADSTSRSWNSIIIGVCALLALLSQRLIYISGCLIADKSVGNISSLLFILSPYTYFYILSGGLTMFVFFGVSVLSYSFLKLVKSRSLLLPAMQASQIRIILGITLGSSFLFYLRPSSLIFALVIIFFSLKLCWGSLNDRSLRRISFLYIFIFSLIICFGAYQLVNMHDYPLMTYKAFLVEPGTYFGYPRELLRQKLYPFPLTGDILADLQKTFCLILWKVTDFASGIVDVRDTHDAQSFSSLLSFLLRVTFGFFFLAPLTLFSILSTILNRKLLLSNGLAVILLATLVSISPSLIGVSMSRYLYMFYFPLFLVSGLLLNQLRQIQNLHR